MRGERRRAFRGGLAEVRAPPCAPRPFRATETLHVKPFLSGLLERGLRQAGTRRDHPIEKIVLRSAGLTRQPSAGLIDEMAATIVNGLGPLLGIAMSGNVHAIRKLTELAADLCAETTALACMHQEAADSVARERTTWPLALSHNPKERRRALRLITGPRRLPLGNPARTPAKPRRTGGFANPANAAVLVALKAIEIERSFRIPSELFPQLQPKWSAAASELSELRSATADAWFKVIWLYICDRHGGAPERSELRRLAEVPEAAGAATLTPAGDATVRAALHDALEQAFLQLVRGRGRRKRRGKHPGLL